MIIQDFPDLGLSIEIQTVNNMQVVNVVTAKPVQVQLNGKAVQAQRSPSAIPGGQAEAMPGDPRLRATYWNPDGTQTTAGTVDLRGEN